MTQAIHPGDVIWTPPGVKHWHGATETTAMTHIAIQASADGTPVAGWKRHRRRLPRLTTDTMGPALACVFN